MSDESVRTVSNWALQFATEVYKSLIVVNGGGVLAIITLYSKIDNSHANIGMLLWGVAFYCFSLVLTVAAGLYQYRLQILTAERMRDASTDAEKWRVLAQQGDVGLHLYSVLCMLAALFFLVASIASAAGFFGLPK